MKQQILVILALVFLAVGCTETPEPINFGKDQCSYCKMTIADAKYGSELVTDKGRVQKYDALECMINDIKANDPAYSGLYAIAFNKPKTLISVDSLLFVISPNYKSPMGANLASFTRQNVPKLEADNTYDWEGLLDKFDE